MPIRAFPLCLVFLLTFGCDGEEKYDSLRSHDNGQGHGHNHCDELDISSLLTDYDPQTNPYTNPDMWLAGPDAADDFVASVNLDTTVVHPDMSVEIVHPIRPEDPDLDIFFVHPTVKLDAWVPGNDDLSDLTNIKQFTTETGARFSTIGRVIAPLYHSANAVALIPELREIRDIYLEIAYQDVEDAFVHYLANHWNGRKLVIMGYSQGGIMTRMLFERLIQDNPAVLSRLVAVMPIGGDIQTDSFEFVPACDKPNQTGCYITFNSYLQGDGPTDDPPTTFGEWVGHETTACTNVARKMKGGVYAMSYFKVPETLNEQLFSALAPMPIPISTPFMAFPDFYAGSCIDDDGVYLEISHANEIDPDAELRWAPIAYEHPFLSTAPPFGSGLHQYDFALAMGDLIEGTRKRATKLDDESKYCVVD